MQSNGTKIKSQDNSVDLILLRHVFHGVEERPRMLKEFFRILRPSGRLAIVERTHRILSGKSGPPIVDEKELVQQIKQTGFSFYQTIPHGKDSIIIGKR